MNTLINNEVLGALALQAIIAKLPEQKINLAKAFLILPLMLNKRTRSLIKSNKVTLISSRDLVLTFPKDFAAVNSFYLDLATTSLNSIILACELNILRSEENELKLIREVFVSQTVSAGKIGSEIFHAAPRLACLLEENTLELYQNFRISL